jgi:hypothetical protein
LEKLIKPATAERIKAKVGEQSLLAQAVCEFVLAGCWLCHWCRFRTLICRFV